MNIHNNKINANSFTEYIGQLENEVAQKAQEANELRVQNRQLLEENQRLTDLTRMLLSSNSFAGFLQELSQTGGNLPSNLPTQRQPTQHQSQPQQAPQPQPIRKDIPAHEASQQIRNSQTHMQVGMTLIPEVPVDVSVFDGPASWNNVLPSNDFQVFSMTDMPEPPKFDMSSLSEKSNASSCKTPSSSKEDLPVISSMPFSKPREAAAAADSSDDLYENEELVSMTLPTSLHTTLTKAGFASDVLRATRNQGTEADLQQLCDEMNECCEKIAELFQ